MASNAVKYPMESLCSMYGTIYAVVPTKAPLEYSPDSVENWALDSASNLHQITQPRLQMFSPLARPPFDEDLPTDNIERTKRVMQIMAHYQAPSRSKNDAIQLAPCVVWFVNVWTVAKKDRKKQNTKAKIEEVELDPKEVDAGVEAIGQLHCFTVDLRGGPACGLILDDRQKTAMAYNMQNMLEVQSIDGVVYGIYSFSGLRPESHDDPVTKTVAQKRSIMTASGKEISVFKVKRVKKSN